MHLAGHLNDTGDPFFHARDITGREVEILRGLPRFDQLQHHAADGARGAGPKLLSEFCYHRRSEVHALRQGAAVRPTVLLQHSHKERLAFRLPALPVATPEIRITIIAAGGGRDRGIIRVSTMRLLQLYLLFGTWAPHQPWDRQRRLRSHPKHQGIWAPHQLLLCRRSPPLLLWLCHGGSILLGLAPILLLPRSFTQLISFREELRIVEPQPVLLVDVPRGALANDPVCIVQAVLPLRLAPISQRPDG